MRLRWNKGPESSCIHPCSARRRERGFAPSSAADVACMHTHACRHACVWYCAAEKCLSASSSIIKRRHRVSKNEFPERSAGALHL